MHKLGLGFPQTEERATIAKRRWWRDHGMHLMTNNDKLNT
jgi:hypothetical protein